MELWSLINKETKELIRFNQIYIDDDFGNEYFFTDSKYSAIWVVDSEEKAKNACATFVHPFKSMNCETPNTEYINIEEYSVIKFNETSQVL